MNHFAFHFITGPGQVNNLTKPVLEQFNQFLFSVIYAVVERQNPTLSDGVQGPKVQILLVVFCFFHLTVLT